MCMDEFLFIYLFLFFFSFFVRVFVASEPMNLCVVCVLCGRVGVCIMFVSESEVLPKKGYFLV